MSRARALPLAIAVAMVLTAAPASAAVPTANSGPDVVVPAGSNAVLSGTASDADGDPLQIRWLRSVVSGGDLTSCTFTGPTALTPISAAGLAPTFNCTTPGQYLLQLVAADGVSSFDSIGALVTFTPVVNHAPVVDSGPSVITAAGTDAHLSGSATDADGDALEIRWLRSLVSGGDLTSCTFTGPTGFTPISAAGLAPTLNCTVPGQYLLQLIAGDGTTSNDDIGALVTFTSPLDLTAPVCSAVGPARGGGFVIQVKDPQSGVSKIRTKQVAGASVTPVNSAFVPAVSTAHVVVRRTAISGRADIRVTNGDGVARTCRVHVFSSFVWVVNL